MPNPNPANEAIGMAVNYAAEKLPEDCILEISIERGAGWAELLRDDGETITSELGLPDSIYELVEAANAAIAREREAKAVATSDRGQVTRCGLNSGQTT